MGYKLCELISLMGQNAKYSKRADVSALHPTSDIARCSRHFAFVPLTEVGFSFDQFVGELLEKQRHLKAQRLGGLEIDDKTKLRRSLHG